MEKMTLQNPITINGKKVKTLTYDTDAITVGMFADAEARKLRATSNKGGGSAGACELDYSLHAYLAMMAIVAVNSDASVKMLGKGDDRPINTESDRAAVLASLESVDLVVVFPDKVPLKVIEEAHPDIYVKGGDYRIEDLPEAKLVAGWGAKTVTVEFEFARSTTALLKKVRSA